MQSFIGEKIEQELRFLMWGRAENKGLRSQRRETNDSQALGHSLQAFIDNHMWQLSLKVLWTSGRWKVVAQLGQVPRKPKRINSGLKWFLWRFSAAELDLIGMNTEEGRILMASAPSAASWVSFRLCATLLIGLAHQRGCPVKFRQGFLHFQGISLHQEATQRLQTLPLCSLCCQRKVWTTGVQVNWSHWENVSAEVGQSRMREMTEILRGVWGRRAELPYILWGVDRM